MTQDNMNKDRRSFLPGQLWTDTSKARYVWLPFTWEEGFPKLHWRETWSLPLV